MRRATEQTLVARTRDDPCPALPETLHPEPTPLPTSRFEGLGSRVEGLGSWVEGLGSGVEVSGSNVEGLGSWV